MVSLDALRGGRVEGQHPPEEEAAQRRIALRSGVELEGRSEIAPAAVGRNHGEAWAARVLFEPSLEPGLKAGLCLREREARAEAAEDLHPAGRGLE